MAHVEPEARSARLTRRQLLARLGGVAAAAAATRAGGLPALLGEAPAWAAASASPWPPPGAGRATRCRPSRSFASFDDAAEEAALSRLYGGIHFRPAIEHGLDRGRCIGHEVNALRTRS